VIGLRDGEDGQGRDSRDGASRDAAGQPASADGRRGAETDRSGMPLAPLSGRRTEALRGRGLVQEAQRVKPILQGAAAPAV
jgi:hypothetical protein